MYGELVPIGGGDPIPLLKKKLTVGRREENDIVLRFSNVSGKHCELTLESGYWYVTDLQSSNGTKVQGLRVAERRLDPNMQIAMANHAYTIRYDPVALGAVGPPPPDTLQKQVFGRSLLEAAGLEMRTPRGAGEKKRYDVMNNRAGQIKDPNAPI